MVVAVQLSAQRIVPGHQLLDSSLNQFRHHCTFEVDITADVVQRRIAHPQLVEPDVLLGRGEGKTGRQAGKLLHKILLMGVRHWPRREPHYGEIAGFEHGGLGLSVTLNPDIQMDGSRLTEGSQLKRLKSCRKLAIRGRY